MPELHVVRSGREMRARGTACYLQDVHTVGKRINVRKLLRDTEHNADTGRTDFDRTEAFKKETKPQAKESNRC
jgi:hypothetical protein